jgi:hypothetical protein
VIVRRNPRLVALHCVFLVDLPGAQQRTYVPGLIRFVLLPDGPTFDSALRAKSHPCMTDPRSVNCSPRARVWTQCSRRLATPFQHLLRGHVRQPEAGGAHDHLHAGISADVL